MLNRAISTLTVIGLTAGLVVGAAGGASAYPPGTALTVTASPSPVRVNATLTATAHHVGPGCKVTFSFGDRSVTVASTGGTAVGTLKAPATPGRRTLSSSTSGCATLERAYTRVTVTGPVVTAPGQVQRLKVFSVTASGFPARTEITIRLTKEGVIVSQRQRTSASGTVTMYFRLSRVGTYLVTAAIGHTYATTRVQVVR